MQHKYWLSDEEQALLSAEFSALSSVFNHCKQTGVIANRKHFPSFNLTMMRIMDRHGIAYDPDDWPVLKTPSCVAHSNKILNFLFKRI
jgi:hypothetical protein